MEQPTIQNVVDQFEQLLIRIMLSVLFRLQDEISGLNRKNDVKF